MLVLDSILRFSLFILLTSISFLLLCPLILDAIAFWTKVFRMF
jgi:hypothetical protein